MFKACVAALVIGCVQTLSASTPTPQGSSELVMQGDLQRLTWLYDGYQKHGMLQRRYLIPRSIHFINLDGRLSTEEARLIQTWRAVHPTWKVKVWTADDLASFVFLNKKAFQNARTLEEKSQILRYEILYREGGLYVGTNFECLRPFDIIHKSSEFYAGIGSTNTPTVLSNSLIGCAAHHPIIRACIIAAGTEDNRITANRGSVIFTKCFQGYAMRFYGKAAPFPVAFFHAKPNAVKLETLAVRHNQ